MGMTCVAVGCNNEKRRGQKKLRFFRIPPKVTNRGRLWRAAVCRSNWTPSKSHDARICHEHFMSGQPSMDPAHPDYVPSRMKHKEKEAQHEKKRAARYDRANRRRQLFTEEEAEVPVDVEVPVEAQESSDPCISPLEGVHQGAGQSYSVSECAMCIEKDKRLESVMVELRQAKAKIDALEKEAGAIRSRLLCVDTIHEKPFLVKMYTGLANINLFLWILSLVLDCTSFVPPIIKGMNVKDQLLLVLVKIKFGLPHKDIGVRFGIGTSAVSKIFGAWIHILGKVCRCFLVWPDRETTLFSLPKQFIPNFTHVRSTIDCFEIFIDRPTLLKSRAQTWSNYKHHQTLKFLISITPNGQINYLSDGWGGRTSDKHITENCGYLDMLECGDAVLADRGFLVQDAMDYRGVRLIMPAFTRGRKQLTKKEVDESRLCARLRIHVERVIRKVKQYKIMQGSVPISLLESIDDCVVVAAAFVNLDVGVIRVA